MTIAEEIKRDIESIASEPTERKQPPKADSYKEPVSNTVESEVKFFGEEPEDIEQETIKEGVKVSGKPGAILTANGIELVFNVLERFQFTRKFSEKEKNILIAISDKNESQLTSDELSLNAKFLNLTKKHEKIRDRIPLNKREMEALETAFEEYAKATGKVIPPSVIVWVSVLKIVCDRSIDIFL